MFYILRDKLSEYPRLSIANCPDHWSIGNHISCLVKNKDVQRDAVIYSNLRLVIFLPQWIYVLRKYVGLLCWTSVGILFGFQIPMFVNWDQLLGNVVKEPSFTNYLYEINLGIIDKNVANHRLHKDRTFCL